MGHAAVQVRGVAKRYRLRQQQAAYGSLRESLSSFRLRRRRPDDSREIWALRDIDLTIGQGESVGLVGTNGAGKSTLLRILARITEPTVGVSRTRGRVGMMLEVGTGFHPELTGRENVFLSGAIMGMTRAEVRRRYEDIVTFAGVEPFLETPLKRYSTGMQLRLAFAVAAHLEPEIMLVDEILAVGDVEFQRQCLSRMRTLSHEGRTVIFVSHDLGALTNLCSRAVWIQQGRIMQDGEAREIVQSYYSTLLPETRHAEFAVGNGVGISQVTITDEEGRSVSQATRDSPIFFQAQLVVPEKAPGLDLVMYVTATDGTIILSERWADQPGLPPLTSEPGTYLIRLAVPPLLRAGDYVLNLWLGTQYVEFFNQEVLGFTVAPRADDRQEMISRRRAVQPVVDWRSERIEQTTWTSATLAAPHDA